MRRLLVLIAMIVVLPGAPRAQTTKPSAPAKPAAPLAPFAGMKVAVVPVQFFKDDSRFVTASAASMRAQFDTLLSSALEERGLKGTWATPLEVLKSGRRNVLYTGDPANMGAFAIRNGVAKDAQLPDPFAGSLRRLIALHDARYVLIPVELFVTGDTSGRGVNVRLVLADGRLNQAVWQVELMGERAANYSPAQLAKLATRVSELVVAP